MKKRNKKITAGILVIGNEILSGRTIDQNISFLALWLNNNLGIKVSEVRIVPDIESKIVKNVLSLSKKNNYVLTTGGIGPTHDDITAKSISKAFKKKSNLVSLPNFFSGLIILKLFNSLITPLSIDS